jgi:gliding motility-associated-like protein
MVLTINPQATANAGVDATICEGSTYTLTDAVASNGASILWTTSGTGSFSSTTVQNPVYTPSQNDIDDGTITLTMTVTSAAPCANAVDQMVLTINRQAVINAGVDATICETGTYTLSSATAINAISIEWTTSGDGTFSSTSTLNPIYTPGAADLTNGTVTLTLTGQSAAPCVAASDVMVLTINLQATAFAGIDATICEGSTYTLADAAAPNATSVLWTTTGTGTYNNATIVNPVYTPSPNDILDGFVTLTMTVTSAAPCTGANDQMVLTINRQAVINAGVDATICETGTYTLSTATAINAISIEWTTSGDDTFSSTSTLNPIYTPGAADIALGTVTLTLTGQSAAPCVEASDAMVLTISPQATADAGIDATICEGSTYELIDAVATNQASILWTTSGTGSFSSTTVQNPVYTPSQNDRDDGMVTFTMTVSSFAGCPGAMDVMTLNISHQAMVNSGVDDEICEGEVFITNTATSLHTTSVLWTSSGTGSFNDPTLLAATYMPSTDDINNGSVVLTITGQSSAPCPIDQDELILTISRQATANAGPDDIICGATPYTLSGATAINQYSVFWTTTGTGTFNSPYSINPTYIPSQNDIDDGEVTLVIAAFSEGSCLTSIDEMILTIQAPVNVNAGNDALICETSTYQLSEATSLNTVSLLWTTSGNGTFDDETAQNPVYTPGNADIAAGSVILTLTGEAPFPCIAVTDEMVLSISPQVTVSAGEDALICENTAFELLGANAQNAASVLWTSSGTGFFNNPSLVNPTYTPSMADIINGSVILTLTGNAISPCANVQDQMILTISRQALVNAGPNGSTCERSPYTISGATASYVESLLWTTSGTGTFADATALNAIYTPSGADVIAGSVSLTLTAQSFAPCGESSDVMVLSISENAMANAGPDVTICEGSAYNITAAVATDALSILWTTSGTGLFSNPNIQNPYYVPSASDILNGSVVLTMNVTSEAPCGNDADFMVLTINRQAAVNAGADAAICEGATYSLNGATAAFASNLLWTTNGTGTFNNAGSLNPVYTPSAADITAGSVVLTLSAQSGAPCGNVSDAMVLTISPQATADAGDDATICEGSAYTLSSAVASNPESILWTSSGGGSFNNAMIENPTYSPSNADILNGSVILTMTVTSAAPCGGSSDQMVLTISRQAEVNAGSDAAICQGSNHQLSGATANFAGSVSWTSSGTGTFSNPTSVNPVYTPSSADIASGTVILTITGSSASPCSSSSDAMTLTIYRQATANAGADATICGGGSYTLSGASATFQNSVMWTTSGTGTFSSQTVINPTYSPSQNDIDDGQVILTLTAYSDGNCASASDAMTLTLSNDAAVSAGADATICEGSTFTPSGASSMNTIGLMWTSSGTGTFDDATLIHPVYTPSMADIISGTVTLTLTGQAPAPCDPVTDVMVLTINRQTMVSAGSDDETCEGLSFTLQGATAAFAQSVLWTTSGSGTFNNPALVNAVYIPSQSDILNGTVTLTITGNATFPCETVSDQMTLTISKQAVISAGSDATICENSIFTTSSASAANASALLWTTLGDGTFGDATQLNTTYTPGTTDIVAGTVSLTLAAQSEGSCAPVSDVMILNISRQAVALAGEDASICESESYSLTGASAIYQTSVYWTTSGTGTFSNANIQKPVYTPSVSDMANGQVVLTITAVSENGCEPVSDNMTLTIDGKPYVTAGPDMEVCQGEDYTVFLAGAENYVSIEWTTNGNGTLLNGNTITPTYVPANGETGVIALIIKATGAEGCGSMEVTDEMLLTIHETVIANAGPDLSIPFNTSTQLEVTATGGSGAYTFNWQPANLLYYSNTSSPLTHILTNHTTFTVLVTDLITGCQTFDSVNVHLEGINYAPVAVDDYDTTAFNTSVMVNVLGNDSDPENGGLTVSICGNPLNGLVVVNSNGTITYSPYAGFSGIDSLCYTICDKGEPVLCDDAMVYITVMPEPDIDDLVIYNGVSPNEDGNNDTWKVRGIEGFPDNTVKIFNRWGTKIWEGERYDNINVFWDATNMKGNRVPDGTYYYILEIKDVKTFTGWIYVRSEN